MSENHIRRVSAREGYDLWAKSYDETPNPVVSMDARYTLKALAPQAGERILDAGCGTGRNFQPMIAARSRIVGIDFSLGMLRVARGRFPDALLALADLQQPLPFRRGCFDAVLCALIGEHLDKLRAVMQGFYEVLKPAGRLVFSVYHPAMAKAGKEAHFEKAGVEYRLGAYRHSVADYRNVIAEAGFSNILQYEYAGDEQLVEAAPSKAARLLRFPVLLIFVARKLG